MTCQRMKRIYRQTLQLNKAGYHESPGIWFRNKCFEQALIAQDTEDRFGNKRPVMTAKIAICAKKFT